jgi:hypothetical protein
MLAAIRQCLVANEQISRGRVGRGGSLSSTPSPPSQPNRGALLEDDAPGLGQKTCFGTQPVGEQPKQGTAPPVAGLVRGGALL